MAEVLPDGGIFGEFHVDQIGAGPVGHDNSFPAVGGAAALDEPGGGVEGVLVPAQPIGPAGGQDHRFREADYDLTGTCSQTQCPSNITADFTLGIQQAYGCRPVQDSHIGEAHHFFGQGRFHVVPNRGAGSPDNRRSRTHIGRRFEGKGTILVSDRDPVAFQIEDPVHGVPGKFIGHILITDPGGEFHIELGKLPEVKVVIGMNQGNSV